jgi:CNT family concentrative nucleoside transporter
MLGVPARDCLRVAELIGLKVVANVRLCRFPHASASHSPCVAHPQEFVAYNELQTVIMPDAATRLSPRAYLIAKYALCGFGNIGSLGINLGILAALAPKRAGEIVRLLPSALLTGILVTLSSAAIAGIVGDPLLDAYVPTAA